ncbi:Ff.00g000690.m01.CDS01 [Fusarium sp. VM40]|nr:Ff.00g000690.m01.CDS01 [Fusarium sp. VM40]
MRLTSLLLMVPLCTSHAQAGSQLWEASAAMTEGSETALLKRAVSIVPSDDPYNNAGVHRWPEKTITYAFNTKTDEEKLERVFEDAKKLWNQLKVNGFDYKKLDIKKCSSRRSECMVIYYNDYGKHSTSLGIRPLDSTFEGPFMHLSDKFGVGNLDLVVNTAHELGHAWGLWHEHQAREWWGHSDNDGNWGGFLNGDIFKTADYHCENLKDYEKALEEMAEKEGLKSKEDLSVSQLEMLCRDRETAEKYAFSALEWMPLPKNGMDRDEEFDPTSLMLYPSGAGGKGEVIPGEDGKEPEDKRLAVLTYPDGKRMPIKKGPAGMDIEKLLKLYGTNYRGTSMLHNDDSSKFKGLLKKMRSKLSLRAGDTEQGMC